jgi:hypothetical protein
MALLIPLVDRNRCAFLRKIETAVMHRHLVCDLREDRFSASHPQTSGLRMAQWNNEEYSRGLLLEAYQWGRNTRHSRL